MNVTDSDTRRNKILGIVIDAYVSTAQPVGSELVARRLRSSLSSATIRNIMVELEGAGFLEQPHTSAGRVPTDRGYRYFVDSVMDLQHLPHEQLLQLGSRLNALAPDVDHVLAQAGDLLAELTQQAAFIMAPTIKRSTVRQVELVPLGARKLLCVLVTNEDMIASHVVEIVEPMTRDEAAALARFINTELVGQPFSGLLESLERRMLAENDSFYHFVKRSLHILQDALSTEPEERLFVEGTSYVIAQPEFARDPGRTQDLLRGLDAEEALLQRIRQDLALRGVRVRIGRELQSPEFDACSYVAVPFAIGDEIVGGIGVLGPKRMDYARMGALVEGMGRCLTELLTRWEGGSR